jgi:hypothetical protein
MNTNHHRRKSRVQRLVSRARGLRGQELILDIYAMAMGGGNKIV